MTDGRGKLGGQVASKNRGGAYVRTKVTPSNPQTSFQSTVRQRLASLSKEWGFLSEGGRRKWNVAADSGSWNKTDIFGDGRRPTGKNLFTGINLVSLESTNTLLTKVPRKANFSQFSVPTAVVLVGGDVKVSVDVSEPPALGTRWQVEATPPVSAGRYYLKNLYRNIDNTIQVMQGDEELTISNPYAVRFGILDGGSVGARVGIRMRQVLDGQVTPWVEVSAIVEQL